MEVEIRILEISDLPFLREMVYESAFVPVGQKPFPRTILEDPLVSKFFDRWGEQSGDIGLIAEHDGKSIGAAWLRLFDEDAPEVGIALLKEFRGHGIGYALMCAIETQAKNYGYQKISLNVNPINPARQLYEKLGYVHIGWDDSYWTMVKDLG